MEDKLIRFDGYNIQPQYLRADQSVRITIDLSQDQLENVKDILLKRLPDGVFEITIEPKVKQV